MRKKIFPLIIALTALAVSASAAIYSVTGLSKLFAGAHTQVIIMAGSLEVAKLVTASLLYQYWGKLNKIIRIYFLGAVAVLMLITSMGIYGYLTAAYQQTSNLSQNADIQLELIETKKANLIEQRDLYTVEKVSLGENTSQLQTGLANNKISYTDKEGNLVQTTSTATRKSFEKQLDNTSLRQERVNKKIDSINGQIFILDNEIVEVKTANNLAGELGPLKYLSSLTGTSMDKIINWLLLVIIFVFDPLAIALVVAANFAFRQIVPKEEILKEETPKAPEKVKQPSQKKPKYEEIDLVVLDKGKEVERVKGEQPSKIGKRIITILERGAMRTKVEYEDGTTGWVLNSESPDKNKIIYMS